MVMLYGGVVFFLLAAYSQLNDPNKASQVASVLAMGMSALVSITGLVYLLVTRGNQHTGGEAG